MKLHQLTQDEMNHLVPGQRTIQDKLLGIQGSGSESEAISASGVLDPATPISYLTVSGTKAYTLADGTFSGQDKIILCVSAASTPLGTVTIATPETATGMAVNAAPVFTSAGQMLHLRWSGSKWRCVSATRAGTQVCVLGTTVLTGLCMAKLYDCQVDGTKDSTTTKALPDGLFPGDRCYIGCSSATNTPIGSIDFVGSTLAGAAVTHLQAIGATTDTVTLEWTGTKWLVVANAGITVA